MEQGEVGPHSGELEAEMGEEFRCSGRLETGQIVGREAIVVENEDASVAEVEFGAR